MNTPQIYLMFGIQGAGKGTQAVLLAQALHIPHISMGDILRETAQQDTPLAAEIRSYIEHGNLVPDELIMPIFKERFARDDCQKGFILDGFPRKLSQAEKLQAILDELGIEITRAIDIHISETELLSRLASRLVCTSCGAVYNENSAPPKTEGLCDQCGGKLVKRQDDSDVEAIRTRIRHFHDTTGQAIEYYRQRDLLLEIHGEQPIADVFQEMKQKLGIV